MRVTVLGASGGIGSAVVKELACRGHAVTAVNRAGDADVPTGVARLAADVAAAPDAKRVCAGSDVVVMAAQPAYHRWPQEWPPMMRSVSDAAAAAGARLVFTDNLYAYAPAAGPLRETSPEHATDSKGVVRRELGHLLLDAHRRGDLRVVIGRFSDYYGPNASHSGLHMVGIESGLRGRTMRGMFDLDQLHTFHYLPDAARGFAELIEHPEADGRIWLLPAAAPITQRELLGLVNAHLDRPVRIGRVTPVLLRVAGWFNPLLREARSSVVQFDRPWVVDATRFNQAFGAIRTTPHAEAVAHTMAWLRQRDDRRRVVQPAA